MIFFLEIAAVQLTQALHLFEALGGGHVGIVLEFGACGRFQIRKSFDPNAFHQNFFPVTDNA
jgi:hypothetical protein